MKGKQIFQIVAFFLIFAVLFFTVSDLIIVSSSDLEYQMMAGIYEEEPDSLDAVYLGSSAGYAFWNANIAWEKYGIAVYPYTSSSQPMVAAEYLIREARKTQPNALYIITTNTLGEDFGAAAIHRMLNFMPLSENKLAFTDYLCDYKQYPLLERLEYYFPIIRLHDKWKELNTDNFYPTINGNKGGRSYRHYLEAYRDISQNYKVAEGEVPLEAKVEESLRQLLDYCDAEQVNALFVTVPRAEGSHKYLQKLNTANRIISERGYPTLDLRQAVETLGMDFTYDYYDAPHTNLHGGIKITHYISNYLIEQYGFTDKRGQAGYESWDRSAKTYFETVSPYLMSFELDPATRDYTLSAPTGQVIYATYGYQTIYWDAVAGADAYAVYRKTNDQKGWQLLGNTDNTFYTDEKRSDQQTYHYAVVPVTVKDGKTYYGHYRYNGVTLAK